MDLQEAVDFPRIHHQWKPDKLYLEKELAAELGDELIKRGWTLEYSGHWSLSQAVMFDALKGDFYGASDSRGVGSAGPASDR
jgi:gamma-glutamyltranspeptidase/glutathione hydrolase